jgi:hypothetical protein
MYGSYCEFVCVDCGYDVIDIGTDTPPVPPRCMVCEWIRREFDPADHPMIRILIGAGEATPRGDDGMAEITGNPA